MFVVGLGKRVLTTACPAARCLVIFLVTASMSEDTSAGPHDAVDLELVDVPGGTFVMGDAAGEADEAPRTVPVSGFRLMRTEVTNAQFQAYVTDTGHRTDAERSGSGYVSTDRWRRVTGADWRHPFGPVSGIAGKGDHPVVQVSAGDAQAFCRGRGCDCRRKRNGSTRPGGPTTGAIRGEMRHRRRGVAAAQTSAPWRAARPMRRTGTSRPRRSDALRSALRRSA
jgi:hypothetical protein